MLLIINTLHSGGGVKMGGVPKEEGSVSPVDRKMERVVTSGSGPGSKTRSHLGSTPFVNAGHVRSDERDLKSFSEI